MMRIILASLLLVGCVAEEGEPLDPSSPEQPEQPEQPAPMTVSVDWGHSIESGGGYDVKEIAVKHFFPIEGGKVVLELQLKGTVTAPGGSTMKLRVNRGTSTWELDGMSSADFESGSCGTWQMSKDSLNGHICKAPGASTVAQTTSWDYSMAETFPVHGTPDSYSYDGVFDIQFFDESREVQCRHLKLSVSRTELGAGGGFDSAPCQ